MRRELGMSSVLTLEAGEVNSGPARSWNRPRWSCAHQDKGEGVVCVLLKTGRQKPHST